MIFLKNVAPPAVSVTDPTESVVRKVIALSNTDGDSARLSDRILDILEDDEDIFDVVALMNKSFRAKPSRRELSNVVTLGDLVSLYDEHRKRERRA